MALQSLIAGATDPLLLLVSHVRSFRADYCTDFSRVRSLALSVFGHGAGAGQVQDCDILPLAESLDGALKNWGAGKRKAPTTRCPQEIARRLGSQSLWRELKLINDWGTSWADASPQPIDCDLQNRLVWTLGELGEACFDRDRRTITYPSKALLLLTGVGPAFDTNVRSGLKAVGIPGWSGTQYRLPQSPSDTNFQKMLSVYAGTMEFCYRNRGLLERAARDDGRIGEIYGRLKAPGRLIDILLFMAGARVR